MRRLIDADALMPKLKFIREAEHQIYGKESWGFASKCITAIEDAPTIEEPEIIYCKKCKHWTMTCGNEQWGLGDCDVFDKHLVMCNGYCAWAERRKE